MVELVSAFLSVIEHHGSAVVQLSCLWRTGIAPPVVDTVHLWVALAELGYLHVLVAGHGSMLAVMQGWILLHSCVTKVWRFCTWCCIWSCSGRWFCL